MLRDARLPDGPGDTTPFAPRGNAWCSPLLAALESYWVVGDRVTFLATGGSTQGRLFACLVQSPFRPEDGDWIKTHVHESVEQSYRMLAGALRCEVDGREFVLGPGESVVIHPGVPHRVLCHGPGQMVMLMSMQPAGIEHFYRAVGTPCTMGHKPVLFPSRQWPDYEALMRTSSQWCATGAPLVSVVQR